MEIKTEYSKMSGAIVFDPWCRFIEVQPTTDHHACAENNPFAYQGVVTRPGTIKSDGLTSTVTEAAVYFNIPPIVGRVGDWAICHDGLYCLNINYMLEKAHWCEPDHLNLIAAKPWVNLDDFCNAVMVAQELARNGQL